MSEINLTKYVDGEVNVSFTGIGLVTALLYKLFPIDVTFPYSVLNGQTLTLPLRDSRRFNYDIMVRRGGQEVRVWVTIKPNVNYKRLYEEVLLDRGSKSILTITYSDERRASSDLSTIVKEPLIKDTLVKCVIHDRASRRSPLTYTTRARNVFARGEINRAAAHPTVNVKLSDDPCQDGEG